MKTPLAIWIQRLVAAFVIILATGLLLATYLQTAEDPTPYIACLFCDDYESRKETIKVRFRALEETRNNLDLQAEKEGLLHHTLRSDGHIDSSAPGGMGHIGTLIYWDKKRKLSYEELAIQQLRVDLMGEYYNHLMVELAEKLLEESK